LRERKETFELQTTEAYNRGIICLRGKNRDPRSCYGYDCATDIYIACVEMLKKKQNERYAKQEKGFSK
jgi:hypothetical protein